MRTNVLAFTSLTVCLFLGMTACGKPDDTANAAEASAPAVPEEQTAENFARGLYAQVGGEGFTSVSEQVGPHVWSAATWSKIQAATEAANGEAGPLDFEPLCSCQDNTDLRLVSLETTSTGPNTADASVGLGGEDDAISGLTLKLVKESGQWRVDDAQRDGEPGVVSLLNSSN